MALGPCLNPNCKSHGKPHPNCHCYDGVGEHMAEGGEITEYCAKGMPHKPGCEYYADGGDVPKYEDSQPVETPQADTPKYEDSTPIAQDVPKYEDSTPVETPKYEDSQPIEHNVNDLAHMSPDQLGSAMTSDMHNDSVMQNMASGLGFNPTQFSKLASPVVTNALQAGLMATGDELHDYLTGNKHLTSLDDDKVAAMHIIGAGGLGALLGKGEKFVGDVAAKFAPKLESIAQGIGASKTELTAQQLGQLSPLARQTYKIFKKIVPATENQVIRVIGGGTAAVLGGKAGHAIGSTIDDVTGNEHGEYASALGLAGGAMASGAAYKALKPLVEKISTPFVDWTVKKVLGPVVIKALSVGQPESIKEGVNYAAKAQAGRKYLDASIDSLFGTKAPVANSSFREALSSKNIKDLEDYINNGGINPQVEATVQQDADNEQPANYAEGGHVEAPVQDQTKPKSLNSNLQHVYPEQHLLNVQNKTKVSNYLQQLKPQKKAGGPIFDVQHPDPIAERSYKRAIHAAIDPTRILEHARKGTLVPDHVKHMNGMYPGVMDLYRHEITKKLMKMQLESKRPPIKLRQNLSMIMGTDLDSTTTPQSIMAAQATFAPKQTPGQGQKAPAKSTAKLDKISKNDTTASQAGTARRQGGKS